jgi:hypothetical protein
MSILVGRCLASDALLVRLRLDRGVVLSQSSFQMLDPLIQIL